MSVWPQFPLSSLSATVVRPINLSWEMEARLLKNAFAVLESSDAPADEDDCVLCGELLDDCTCDDGYLDDDDEPEDDDGN